MTLKFKPDEYHYLARVANKLKASRNKLTEKEWSKGDNAVIKELANKFSIHVALATEHEVPLKRTHLRYLQAMLSKSIEVSETSLLPEYKRRTDKDYSEYITKLEQTISMLKDVLTKIEGNL